MSHYPLHTVETAPEQSKPALQELQRIFGFIPNIAAAMANAPALLNGFLGLFAQVHASSLSEAQIQALLLTNAVTNRSEWATAFHTALGLKQGLSQADVEAIRNGRLPDNKPLAALSTLARTLIEKRGCVDDLDKQHFTHAGFTAAQILEVIAVVAASTITNYTGSVTLPALEPEFAPFAWRDVAR